MSGTQDSAEARYKSVKSSLEQVPGLRFSKIVMDKESGIIRILPENLGAISRAVSGLDEVLELAYTTAEHHPYWGILYHCSEISKLVLEAWEGEFTSAQIDEIRWRNREVLEAMDRIADRGSSGQEEV